MTPDDLRTAVAAATGPAASTALDVRDDPGATIHADREVQGTTANLLTIYRRRADHASDMPALVRTG